MPTTETRRWRFKAPEMEGPVARWYARLRGTPSQVETYRKEAAQLTAGLAAGASVLEVAPGPGYLAIEIARLGRLDVTGLDISHTFVEIGRRNAREAGIYVDFRQGDVAAMPFASGSFDLVVCQAAFKNFTRPHTALSEMYRVLRDGGRAVIQDMSHGASHEDIELEVAGMEVGRFSAFTTKATLEMLKRRAYSRDDFERLAADSPFQKCVITTQGIGLEVRLDKET
ncbi:MAG TPA: class I SAM-dependent methyltransferase [Candidatus Dormibacteraeota bacterium]|nr:class I SAM-dependent methyltransferase [Candidatus Dormibacteraeota bacterium]